MKTKKLLFCLLLLIMGTTTAWADKYYTVGKRVTGQLEFGTGKKYMIFNTTFDGTQNRSGFLYNMGTTFGLKRFTSVDKYICTEAFVFQLENAGDDDPHSFYLKSVASGGYMNLDGQQSVNPTKLNLYTWDEARAGDDYTVSTGGVTITEKNGIKQACVKSLNASYTVVTENNVTSESNAVYVIANQNNSWYFNGNTDSYATWTDGHPYAFYECHEITSAETFNLQDLHIYSRADYYSAHVMYGYITDASQITSGPLYDGKPYEGEGAIAGLIDGNFKTYNMTNWHDDAQVHYYQIDLKEKVSSLRLYMATRSDKKHAPLEYEILATNDPNGEWVKVSEGNRTTLNTYLAYVSPIIDLDASYQYIRIQAPSDRSSAEQCLALSELYVLPNRDEINSTMAYFDHTLPAAATEVTYKAIIDQYNANATASAAKLFSGVPIAGNKYRIYADAYSGDAYVNRHVNIKADGETRSLNALGDYFTAGDAQEAFEWYCEESTDGKLLFRNVKYPDLYLANSRVVTVDSISEAKWTINTNYTQHQGVPLINRHGQYLTAYNNGAHWAGDVKKAMNQTIVTGTLDIKNTLDNPDDDVQANGGLCTDFVFIPVDLDIDEVRLTITASELGYRNSTLTVGGETYKLPFSKVFYNGVPEITIGSTAGEFYTFTGFYKGDTKIGDAINSTLFTNSTLASGDVVEARFEVTGLPVISNAGNIVLYQIKNRRAKTIQNAGMSRAGLEYDDDEFISMENGKDYFYASFITKDKPLELSNNKDSLTANSFFYFTNSEPTSGETYQAYINSAVTTFRNNKSNEWNSGGSLHYIQPNAVSGGVYGFAITRTQLDGSNNPYGWNAQYSNTGNIVVEYGVEDANSAWEFVPVEENVANEKLTLYIKEVAAEMITHLTAQLGTAGVDDAKINNTIAKIKDIAGTYTDGQFGDNGAISTADVTALVGYAQELHMLHHEVEYAMQALPEVVDENATPFQPQWYYIKNVHTGSYARYNGADNLMSLTENIGDNKLPHLFYFAGEKFNEGTMDEYLAAHIHNFMALDLKDAEKDSTIVSYNRELLSTNVSPVGNGGQTEIFLDEAEQLKSSEAWTLELDFDLASGAFFNGWGSGLLAAGGNGTATQDGGTYQDGFQVYLQNSGNVVIRGGDSGANDGYKFTHTVGKYSKLKVVLTYANHRLQVSVTNSEGVTATIKDTPTGLNKGRDYIPCQYMMDVTKLASAMAGASSFKLKAEVVLAMKWDTHANNIAADVNGDKWYILPSSNTQNPGLAIVTGSADCANMGWSNVNGSDVEIFTAPGVDDFSTWQFEKVERYDVHVDELLDLYDIKDCVVYNAELVELYKTINEIVATNGKTEGTFNALLNAIREYSGPTPEEFKAPKPGSLYTIRPAVGENTENALLVHVDAAKNNYATREVYNGDVIRDDSSYDSRAAWMFEGNVDSDGFFALNGLTVKNLHTQCYLTEPGADSTMVSENAASVTLAQLGACTTMFKVGNKYMVSAVRYAKKAGFWGSAIAEYPAQVDDVFDTVNGASTVHCKTFDVLVSEQGDVTVTFTHKGGDHKLNILGVTLTDVNGDVVTGDYRHSTAGGNPSVQTYTLTNVSPATYTLNCYVCELDGGDNDKLQSAQGDITFSGISQFTGTVKVTNSGTATTKWIIEEIKDPENSIYYNVPSLSSATLPDTKAYASLYLGFDAKIPDGVTAWIVEEVLPNTQLVMVEVEGGIVPANTGLILSSENPMTNQKFYYSAEGSTFNADWNILTGTAYTKIVDCREQNVYMLGKKNDRIALYWTYENRDANGNKQTIGGTTNHNDSGYVMCNANKSYLEESTTNENAVSVYGFSFGAGTTDIDEVKGEPTVDASQSGEVKTYYDLQGRKLEKVVAPGVYIVNGKKVLVK